MDTQRAHVFPYSGPIPSHNLPGQLLKLEDLKLLTMYTVMGTLNKGFLQSQTLFLRK